MKTMTKYQPDHADYQQFRKNRLDKVYDLLYNIRTGLKKREWKMNKIELPSSAEDIQNLYNEVAEVFDKKSLGEVILAGGAVRDRILNLHPRDYDFFVRPPEGEDLDDWNVYVCALMAEKMEALLPYGTRGGLAYPDERFVTYTITTKDRRLLQFVTCSKEHFPDPEGLVAGFDHDLVRCYLSKDGLFVDERFQRAVSSGRVPTETEDARRRLLNWRDRTGYKITIGKPPQKKAEKTDSVYW